MKFALTLFTALLSTAAAWKCECDSFQLGLGVCQEQGHQYASNSCGVAGCCLNTDEIDAFRDRCEAYGGRLKACHDCPSCY